jgi:Arc/MetJ family transcription regulator
MRTNIVIDDELMAEAMAASGLKTKRETVEAGLRLLASRRRQAAARELFGKIRWEGDLDADRCDTGDDNKGDRQR